MMGGSWKRFIPALAGCGAVLVGIVGPAGAVDDREVDELRARVEKLEQQNEQLIELLKQFQRGAGAAASRGEGVAADDRVKQEMERVIDARIRAHEELKQKQEGQRKQQEERKKKQEEEQQEQEQEQQKALEARQQAQEEARGQPIGGDLTFKPTWGQNGLTFTTPNQDFQVHVGGRFELDGVWYQADPSLQTGAGGVGPLLDGANFRRARVRVDGTIYEVIRWVTEFDFASGTDRPPFTGTPGFFDLYFDITRLPVVGNVRAGHFREPFSLERLTSGNFVTFLERSLADEAFVPVRNDGLMLFNAAFDERVTWASGVFRTDSNPFGADFGDGQYATTSRVTFLPWSAGEGRSYFHLGGGYSHRNTKNAQTRYRARPEERVGAPFFADTGPIIAESENRYGTEALLTLGPLSVQSEYFFASPTATFFPASPAHARVARGSALFHGFYVQASYFLTGEHRPYIRPLGIVDRTRPLENFFLVRTGPEGDRRGFGLGKGAWEVAVRYSQLDLRDSGIDGGELRDWTLGLNWYLNPFTKIQWNYIHALRDAQGSTSDGVADIFAVRFHIDY